MKTYYTVLFFAFFSFKLSAQIQTDDLLVNILKKSGKFDSILAHPEVNRVQILYTQIDRDKKNRPQFKSFAYRLNKDEYFYPASTVKLPACLLALEKINDLNTGRDAMHRVSTKNIMITDSSFSGQTAVYVDTTNLTGNGFPTIEHYIKKILLVSDNDAFNRLYEFIGQEPFNNNLKQHGLENMRITHRLSAPLSVEQNQNTNPIKFYDYQDAQNSAMRFRVKAGYRTAFNKLLIKDLKPIYEQPLVTSKTKYVSSTPIKLGLGEMNDDGKINYVPKDFSTKNCYPISDQQQVLRTLLFPETIESKKRFRLTDDDYKLVYKYMSQLPTETSSPPYKTDTAMYDSYCKFLMFGDNKKPMPKNIRIFNKVGDAYGFLIDNAYIIDTEKGVEFLLSTIIYCNADGIFNDDKYDYDTVGYPFMANLGKTIYDFECQRPKKIKPDLSKFKIDYDK